MAEEQQLTKITIQKQSVFKLRDFYEFLNDLVTSQGFYILEDLFSREGSDTSFEWTCLLEVDDYVRFKLWIQCKVLGAKDVKVKREGLSEPMIKADVKVVMKPRIITDWQDRWGTNPFTKFLKGLFDRYLLGSTFEDRKKKLLHKTKVIENEVKSFFELPRFIG